MMTYQDFAAIADTHCLISGDFLYNKTLSAHLQRWAQNAGFPISPINASAETDRSLFRFYHQDPWSVWVLDKLVDPKTHCIGNPEISGRLFDRAMGWKRHPAPGNKVMTTFVQSAHPIVDGTLYVQVISETGYHHIS